MGVPKSGLIILILSTLHGINLAETCGFDCQGTQEEAFLTVNNNLSAVNSSRGGGKDTETGIVKFFMYSRSNTNTPEMYTVIENRKNIFSTFQPQRPTKIIIHGWLAKVPSLITDTFKKAYLSFGDYNLIMVDWSSCGSLDAYPWAKSMIPFVANQFAKFIDLLRKRYDVRPEELHLIGHSLGAHIAGVAGRLIATGKIGRISGLDPAGPLFDIDRPRTMLTRNSAKFVDVIHTCGSLLGIFRSIGHVDFYPNGGTPIQPGCGLDITGACSHRRAYAYFSESILYPEGFKGRSCNHWLSFATGACNRGTRVVMGEHVDTRLRGIFYLKTNGQQPFGLVRKIKKNIY